MKRGRTGRGKAALVRWVCVAMLLGTGAARGQVALGLTDPRIPGIPGQKSPLPDVILPEVHEASDETRIEGGGVTVHVQHAPFGVAVVRQCDEEVILRSGQGLPLSGFSPLAFTRDHGFTWNRLYWGYRGYFSLAAPCTQSADAVLREVREDRVLFEVSCKAPRRGSMLFVVGPFYAGAVRLAASVPPGEATFDRTALTFAAPGGEHYAGFGERFNGIDQRGKRLACWAEEGSMEPGCLRMLFPHKPPEWAIPGGEDATYAPIPFFVSSRGYGILADMAEPTHFDMGASNPCLWRVEAEASHLSLVVFCGPTPAEALRQYTERTGRSLAPRPWVLAPWNQFLGYPEGNQEAVAKLFRERDIPSSVSHEWTAILPTASYAGREEALKRHNRRMHDLGYKSLCYIQPRVDRSHAKELWQEGVELGHFLKDSRGEPYVFFVALNLLGQSRYRVSKVDFTHEGVDTWWHCRLQTVIDLGFDGTMYDFGEYVPADAQFSDGRDGHYWHNAYNLIYLRSAFRFFEGLDDDPGDALAPDFVYFHRSAYAGSQQWSWAMWDGDPEADWSWSDGFPAQVCGGINAGLSGMPFWGSDIGGFHAILVDAPGPELLKRWIQFGAFSGLMRDMTAPQIAFGKRVHAFDEPELTYVVRRYQKLRTQLVPYIVNAAFEAHETGMPLMRAPFLHSPEDDRCWEARHEYFFGPDLYVAPVVEQGALERTLYLPPGQWVELWRRTEYDGALDGSGTGGFRVGGEPLEGGRMLTVDAPIDEIPVFVRLGAVVPMAAPRVDTWAPASPPDGVSVTAAEECARELHVWAFPFRVSSARLSDGSRLEVRVGDSEVAFTRSAGGADAAELVVQCVWPDTLGTPVRVTGLTPQPGADPLALPAGTWTWHSGRHALAFHSRPGEKHIVAQTEALP